MLNKVILIGRLTRDPELTYTANGIAVCKFTLAVDRPRRSDSLAEKEADFIPVVVWRQLAENCANYLKKGRMVAVDGRLQIRSYENKDGKRVNVTEVIPDNVRFLERNTDENGTDHSYSRDNDAFRDDGKPLDIQDDDLPF